MPFIFELQETINEPDHKFRYAHTANKYTCLNTVRSTQPPLILQGNTLFYIKCSFA